MWVPGFGTDELRPYKKASVTEAHKQVNFWNITKLRWSNTWTRSGAVLVLIQTELALNFVVAIIFKVSIYTIYLKQILIFMYVIT